VSKLDLISGRIRQGDENPASIQQREQREAEQKKRRKPKEKRPFWKQDWRK